MSKITENIDGLREIITDTTFDKPKALRFLSALEVKVKEFEKKHKQLEEDAINEEWSIENFTTIDGGIGKIKYNADNLALIDVMENLDAAIQKINFKKVNEILSAL